MSTRPGTSDAPRGRGFEERNYVASLGKGLDVLTCFDRAHPKLTVSEAARRTGVSPASARRSLLTLQGLGYLAHDGKRFWLLPRVLLVANAYLASRPTPNLVQPLLDSLSERTRESASIAQLMDDQSIIIARSTARRSLTVGLRIGSTLPAHCSATGRVLLAALPPEEAALRVHRMTLSSLTPRTLTTPQAVLEQIAICRRDGHSVCDGELELEVRSMAVPVANRSGIVIGALSIAVRADRMDVDELRRTFLPALRRAQARLKDQLFED
ncbi:MAG: transcriptional regulator, IclR family [Rhizobacter sp.]|nr:transcriptional regulator, IclR family [Rhizobacter sp.]